MDETRKQVGGLFESLCFGGCGLFSLGIVCALVSFCLFSLPQYLFNRSMLEKKPLVKQLMEEHLKEKYQEEFVVEKIEFWRDIFGGKFYGKAFSKEDPEYKFDIRVDYIRIYEDAPSVEEIKKRIIESDYLMQKTKRSKEDLLMRLKQFYAADELTVTYGTIGGSEEEIRALRWPDLGQNGDSTMAIRCRVFANGKHDAKSEIAFLAREFAEHLKQFRIDRFVIVIQIFSLSAKEEEKKRDLWFSDWRVNCKEIATLSYYLYHFREALAQDHKAGKLKRACILFSFDCPGNVVTEEIVAKSFLFQ